VNGYAQPCLALIGMPQSGKSTYLGALWALVQSPIEEAVREASFIGDRSYIQSLAEQVARGEELHRTGVDADEEMAVELEFTGLGRAAVRIPDTSGESLRVLVESQLWHPRLRGACANATAVMLFVHPAHIRVPQPSSLLTVVEPSANSAANGTAVPFDVHDHACTAAELIDVFENVTELCRLRWPIRVAVIVSAWDRLDETLTPYEWLRARLPGFVSTVESGAQMARLEVFGVSAQGGSLDAHESPLAKGEICDRVFAKDRSGMPVSLVAPMRWAVFGQ